jgi:diguanylate cyclase (GGDEF)-like protein/PAS domain S-box-containing protein
MAKIIRGLRAGARPRDLRGRVQLLLLASALANSVGALVVAAGSVTALPLLYIAGLAAPLVLTVTWLSIYRRDRFGVAEDIAIAAAMSVFALAVETRWSTVVIALLTAGVFFGAVYGSRRRVLARTGLLSVVALVQGWSDATAFTMSAVIVGGFFLVAYLLHGMVDAVDRYERTARREQVLAATGLDLVVASDMAAIAAATVDGGHALCAHLPGVRVSLAISECSQPKPPIFVVLGSAGRLADEMLGTFFGAGQLVPEGQELADQRLLRTGWTVEPAEPAATGSAAASGAAALRRAALVEGEALVTRISVAGDARGVFIVESSEPIADELPAAIRALATQAALAIARIDLAHDTVERESAARFQAIVQSSSDIISIVSADGRIRYQSPSVLQIFGHRADALIGQPIATLIHPGDFLAVDTEFRLVAAEAGSSRVCELRLRHVDGSWRHTETRITNMLHEPAIEGIVLNTRDVTERHTLEAQLRHQAFHDSVTGLANRALFTNRIEHSLAAAKRDMSTVAVLSCDMSGLKRVTDSMGYTTGDAALIMVADRLRACVRGHDTVARMGGEEFAILLDRLASPADATLAMERIMTLLNRPLQLPGAQVELQPNIGLVVSVGGGESAEDLLRNGALAMHQARIKEGGFALFDPEMHADAIRRIEVESQLRTAIEQRQFMMYYQPTIDLQTGRLTGVEALVRWQHPRRGVVPPMEFIPLAEETGLIVPLGQWAIQEACRQVRIWQDEIPADEPLALNVNLSARQLRHPNIVRDIADALDASGLLPSRLILEITESVLMIDTAATLHRLFQLKSLGVRLAVDDFGTGYSSFAYLRRFPIDILKIDKSFVDGVATEPTASALVDAMIRIGKTLRLETVAEGVERLEQADQLRTLQCDIGQGYLFSRPMPSEAVSTFLRGRLGGQQADAA